MGALKAEGRLMHQFHGTYRAVIALLFTSEAARLDARASLGADWTLSETANRVLLWSGDSEALEKVKVQLDGLGRTNHSCGWRHCKDKCKKAPIDSIAHSIDCGPGFDVEIPCTPREQGVLCT